jgi:hypothetical protein
MLPTPDPALLADDALLEEARRLASVERAATTDLIVALREVDGRRLYLSQGYSCMFYYCTQALRLSEQAAYRRIEVARASRAFPSLLRDLRTGALTLTTALLLVPHITAENEGELLQEASFKSKRDVERLLAGRIPALYASRRILQFEVDDDVYDRLLHARALLRHQIPDGDTGAIFGRALTLLIADVERTKLGMVARPRNTERPLKPGSRTIPARVRREVLARDGAQCAFRGADGRCPERAFLEFHHVRPFAEGGPPTVENIELRCRAHNLYEADLVFGT